MLFCYSSLHVTITAFTFCLFICLCVTLWACFCLLFSFCLAGCVWMCVYLRSTCLQCLSLHRLLPWCSWRPRFPSLALWPEFRRTVSNAHISIVLRPSHGLCSAAACHVWIILCFWYTVLFWKLAYSIKLLLVCRANGTPFIYSKIHLILTVA